MGFGSFFRPIFRPVRKIAKKVTRPVVGAVASALNVDKGPSAAETQAKKRADQQLAARLKSDKAKAAKSEKASEKQLSSTASTASRVKRRGGRRAYRLLLSPSRSRASQGIKGGKTTLG
jgi:hypothetical protein